MKYLCAFGCGRALETAIRTATEARDPELRQLAAIAGRVPGAKA